jgi:chitosanase
MSALGLACSSGATAKATSPASNGGTPSGSVDSGGGAESDGSAADAAPPVNDGGARLTDSGGLPSSGPQGDSSASWGGTNIPFPLSGGLTALQADAILSLTSIAEHGDPSWWSFYNNVEIVGGTGPGGDGNGYTFGLGGFTTKNGDGLYLVQDLQKLNPNHPLVTKYLSALVTVNGTSSLVGLDGFDTMIGTLQDDQDYRLANWHALTYYFWDPAMAQAASLGVKYPISKGQLYDINLNAGDLGILSQVKTAPPAQGGSEIAWLTDLQNQWATMIDTGGPGFAGSCRARMYQALLNMGNGNLNLGRPITATCDTNYTIK